MSDCADEIQVAAAADVLNLWPGETARGGRTLNVRPIDPGWSGWGWDQQLTLPVGRCLRLGLREQVVKHDMDIFEAGFSGSEWHFITQAMVGAEVALPGRFAAGAYLLPGVRAVRIVQHVDVPERDLRLDYRDTSFVPSLGGYGAVRWWATPALGVHADVRVPLADFRRSFAFPDRFVGVGIDGRWGGGGEAEP